MTAYLGNFHCCNTIFICNILISFKWTILIAKKLFCFQNDHLQSSTPHDTATVAITTLPGLPTEQTVYKVELKVITPVIVGIIVLLMIILCIRYRLEQSTWFQSLLSTLNGTSAKHRPHFDPPPEYQNAKTIRESYHLRKRPHRIGQQ